MRITTKCLHVNCLPLGIGLGVCCNTLAADPLQRASKNMQTGSQGHDCKVVLHSPKQSLAVEY